MRHSVTVLTGEQGEATSLVDHVMHVVDATGVAIDWHRYQTTTHALPEAFLADARASGRVLMPFLYGPRDAGEPAPIVAVRRALGVYANIRPVRSLSALDARFDDVDFVVIRETSEDIYTSLEHESIEGIFEGIKVTTEAACERIARFAFERARALRRKKLTIVHKSNIMKMSDGLFLRTAQRVGQDYQDIEVDERIADALCMQLTMWPSRFDVVLCANLFGDIVADLGAGLVGGAANCPSINVGTDGVTIYTAGDGDREAMANSDAGNPIALLIAAAHLLYDLGADSASRDLHQALETTLTEDLRPQAVGGHMSMGAFCEAVLQQL